ncbi:MAG: DUF4160 domain-containing protein [Candidatus Competibacteraceae bacterium]|jgi:hypothetical protein|nr:DUF4160 domain-containing protein [Candidatus Competibacteraceae bacterium]
MTSGQHNHFTPNGIFKTASKLVLAWAELHQEDLMANWNLLMNGEEPFKIQPLQ